MTARRPYRVRVTFAEDFGKISNQHLLMRTSPEPYIKKKD